MSEFADKILTWWDEHGRKDLPWQQNPTPYRVWVSEIMLQQTQVKTVIPYYQRFMERFPSVEDLANAEQDEVLHLWTGLGYYARARNLHKCAQQLVELHGGEFPQTLDEVIELSGIGRSTAAAILSLSRNQTETILDGNVKRVLARYFAIREWQGLKPVENELWQQAIELTPSSRNNHYTQAMMDMGATLCTRSKPSCLICPVNQDCLAYKYELTTQIPASKPKKEKPVKRCFWLVVIDESGRVMLEQRPQTGIWGGLHVFPQFEELEQLAQAAALKGWGEQFKGAQHLAEFRHTFSHYHLDINAVVLQANSNQVCEPNEKWVSLDLSTEQLGLAAPVVKVCEQLQTIL